MDQDDKAHDAHQQVIPGVTPGALLDAMDDPEIFASVARGDLYVQMAQMREIAKHDQFPTSQRLEYIKTLSRMGKVADPGSTENPLHGLPLIEIDLGAGGGSVTISPVIQPRAMSTEKEVAPTDQDVGDVLETGFGSGNGMQSTAVLP